MPEILRLIRDRWCIPQRVEQVRQYAEQEGAGGTAKSAPAMNAVQVRAMVEGDIATVAALEALSPSAWSPTSLAAELARLNGVQLVLVDTETDSICGWCCAFGSVPEAELLKIAVDPAMRQSGLATALLRHLVDWLGKHHFDTVYLEVREGNTPAVRFYRKQGFVEIGRRPGYYSNPVETALIFKKNLYHGCK